MFWEEDHRSEVLFSSHHIKGASGQQDITVDVDLDHLTEVGSVGFLHCQVIDLCKECLHLLFKCSLKNLKNASLDNGCWMLSFSFFIIYFWLCWVFIAALAFSSCGAQGLVSSCGVMASHCCGSLIAEHGLQGVKASVVAASRL